MDFIGTPVLCEMSPQLNIRQQGFGMIMGIFLIVVLGSIAVLLGKIASMQIQESTLDELGIIAKQAAKAGIEWGAFGVMHLTTDGTDACPASLGSPASPISFTLASASTMDGFTDVVACSYYQNNSAINVYLLSVTACNSTSATCPESSPPSGYVERNLTVTLCSTNGNWTNLCSF